jgi:hypothetical protein
VPGAARQAQQEHVSIGSSLKALVQKREQRACWYYGLWLAGYCVLAFITTAYAAVLGQDYRWPMFILLVPAVVGCVQFRFPTLLGWVMLVIPTALGGVVALCVFPWMVKGAVVTHDWWQVLAGALLLTLIGAVLHGLIRYRPFKN